MSWLVALTGMSGKLSVWPIPLILPSYSRVDLVKVDRGIGLSLDRRIVLEDAHGEEIVRSVYVDDEVRPIPNLVSAVS
jgi:hypothetical protein